jgi:hypothetical protein
MPERTSLNDLFGELERCTVGIKVNDSINGTGIIVSEDGLILTCYHVVGDRVNKKPFSNNIKVILSGPEVSAEKPVTFEHDKSNANLDIGFLKLLDKFDNSGIAKLDKSQGSFGHTFYAKGFRKPHIFKSGVSAKGEIRELVRTADDVLRLQIHCTEVEMGMSGSAILDVEAGRVVGMISLHYRGSDEATLSFAIPVESVIESFPKIEQENPGLVPLNKFLQTIGEERSSIYKWIDKVYVPPNEYEEIKAALKNDRIVFIIGTKEFGKTFTAVRLLYEYYMEGGYQPAWVKERRKQGGPEGADPEELLRLMREQSSLKSHEIVYFEDPFGKTKYESYSELESYIGEIIDSIKRVEDAYVIITTREEVFKEFERSHFSSIQLADFEKKLNLKRASYDIEKRKQILLKWAEMNNCRWLLNSDLRKLVLDAIDIKESLPTPLNIRDFVKASVDLLDSEQLQRLIIQKSQDTVRRFADEIMEMKEEGKIVFLTFPYIGNGQLNIDYLKYIYDRTVTLVESSQNTYMNFNMVKEWFQGDKINISDSNIEFSHPSYHEAFRYAVNSNKPQSGRIRDIFAKVATNIVEADGMMEEIASVAARTILENFDKLPSNVNQILFRLANISETRGRLFNAIKEHFDSLPPDTLEQLLLMVADEDRVQQHVPHFIITNFKRLPPNVQGILFTLANNWGVWELASEIAKNFHKLPPNVQHILFTLADSDKTEAHNSVADAIAEHFDSLPPDTLVQLLLKLADQDQDSTREKVSSIVKEYSNNIHNGIRKEILAKLKERDNNVRERLSQS